MGAPDATTIVVVAVWVVYAVDVLSGAVEVPEEMVCVVRAVAVAVDATTVARIVDVLVAPAPVVTV